MVINFSELKKKEVVNVSTGKNEGKKTDLVIDSNSGKILKIIVPGKRGILCSENLEIDFDCIEKIGDDIVLYRNPTPKKTECCHNENERLFELDDE